MNDFNRKKGDKGCRVTENFSYYSEYFETSNRHNTQPKEKVPYLELSPSSNNSDKIG